MFLGGYGDCGVFVPATFVWLSGAINDVVDSVGCVKSSVLCSCSSCILITLHPAPPLDTGQVPHTGIRWYSHICSNFDEQRSPRREFFFYSIKVVTLEVLL